MHGNEFPLRLNHGIVSMRCFFLAVLLMWACVATAAAQQVKVYVSSQAGDRIALKKSIRFEQRIKKEQPSLPVFRIDDRVKHQTIVGFGASFLEAGMICLNS